MTTFISMDFGIEVDAEKFIITISVSTKKAIIREILRLLEVRECAAYPSYVRNSATSQTPKEPC